ncbi:MAG: nucleoside deaminase, partial [candidate division WOR-3 bacterium]
MRSRESLSDREAMELAITQAARGIRKGQSPFGCILVRNGKVLSRAHNTVWQDCDPSAHAEVNAIRQACRRLRTIDLSGTVLYATCEPCPMCFGAAHWARIAKIVFGASIRDAAA